MIKMKEKLLVWINVDFIHFGISRFLQEKKQFDLYSIIDIQDITKDFFLKQKIVNYTKNWFYRDSVLELNNQPDINYLSEFEKKYNVNLWEIIYSEIIFFDHIRYHKFSDIEILKILEKECKFFEKIFEEIIPDYLLVNAFSAHHTYLFCKMCEAKGVKILMYTPTRVGYRAAITSHYDILDIFDESVQKSSSGKMRTFEEIQNYLKQYSLVQHNKEDAQRFDTRITKSQELSSVLRFLKFLLGNPAYRKFYGNYGKTTLNIIRREAKIILRKRARNKFLIKNSIKNLGNQPFVYYPLQVEPERVLSFGSPFYYNQLELLTLVAKALPLEYKLFVKEHPMMYTTEGRDIEFYKKIINLPNVYLIDTSIEPEEMLKNCSLVTTISGTAALEAAFYGKPSIIFAKTSYSFLPSVTTLKNLDELPNAINSSLKKKVDLNSLNTFLDYIETNSFEFDSRKIESDVAKTFFYGGFIGNVEIPEQKMISFLEIHKEEFEKLCSEHIKKINQYKNNELDNALTKRVNTNLDHKI